MAADQQGAREQDARDYAAAEAARRTQDHRAHGLG